MLRSRSAVASAARAAPPARPAPAPGPSPRAGGAGSCGRACGGRGRRGHGPRSRRTAGRPGASARPWARPARPARTIPAPDRRRLAGRASCHAVASSQSLQGLLDQVVGELDRPGVPVQAIDQHRPRRDAEPPQAANQPMRRNRASSGSRGTGIRASPKSSLTIAAARHDVEPVRGLGRTLQGRPEGRQGRRPPAPERGRIGRCRRRPGRPGGIRGCRDRSTRRSTLASSA